MNITDEIKNNECLKYHKDLHNHISNESIRCNSCTSTFHKQRDQRQLTFYRKNPYCLSCLKNKEILRYNPYYEGHLFSAHQLFAKKQWKGLTARRIF